jgi:dipeptidase E
MAKRLMLLSNSTMAGERYLGWPEPAIRSFLGTEVKRVFFVPFAGVRITWDDYTAMVRERFAEMGYELLAAHETADPVGEASSAEALVVGGGNTFHLLSRLYESGLMEVIGGRAEKGTPYIGWSAGSNVACPTIKTTNDMPVIEPPTFDALGLVPFQINPHFTDVLPEGHGGETRTERILEFLQVNPAATVVGLREGTYLRLTKGRLSFKGERPARIFKQGEDPVDFGPEDDWSPLLGR